MNSPSYQLDPLESRVMLSAGVAVEAGAATGAAGGTTPSSAIQEQLHQPSANGNGFGNLFEGLTPASSSVVSPAADQEVPATKSPATPLAPEPPVAEKQSQNESAEKVLAADAANEAVQVRPPPTTPLSALEETPGDASALTANAATVAVETLTAANPPPGLSGDSEVSFSPLLASLTVQRQSVSDVVTQVAAGFISADTIWSGTVYLNGSVTLSAAIEQIGRASCRERV